MRVILGIGNPGNLYKANRHNAGFILLDYFAKSHSLLFTPSKSDFYFCEGVIQDSKFLLVRPTTFINNSGTAAHFIIHNYGLAPQDLLVVHDDINLEISKIKIKISGGDGGHNGVSSIIYHLESDKFPRLRIGIGNKFEKGEMAEYVLSNFTREEKINLNDSFKFSSYLIEQFIIGGIKQLLDANSKAAEPDKN